MHTRYVGLLFQSCSACSGTIPAVDLTSVGCKAVLYRRARPYVTRLTGWQNSSNSSLPLRQTLLASATHSPDAAAPLQALLVVWCTDGRLMVNIAPHATQATTRGPPAGAACGVVHPCAPGPLSPPPERCSCLTRPALMQVRACICLVTVPSLCT